MAKSKKGRIAPELLEAALQGIEGSLPDEMATASAEELAVKAAELASEYDFDSAALHYKAAVSRSAGHTDLVAAFAAFLVDEAGWVDHALALLAIQGCSEGGVCQRIHARALTMAGRNEEALERWSAVNSLEPDADSLKAEFGLLLSAGRLREAVPLLERFRQQYPTGADVAFMDKQIREALAPFWAKQAEEFQRLLDADAPGHELERALATLKGMPGSPASMQQLRVEAEQRLNLHKIAAGLAVARNFLNQHDFDAAFQTAALVLELQGDCREAKEIQERCREEHNRQMHKALHHELQRRLQEGDSTETLLWLAGKGLATATWLEMVPANLLPPAHEIAMLVQHVTPNPNATHLQALGQLREAEALMASGQGDEAEALLPKLERVLAGLPALETLRDAVTANRQARKQKEVDGWLAGAAQAFLSGEPETAADLLRRAAGTEGTTLPPTLPQLQERVNEALRTLRDADSVRKRLSTYLDEEAYFEATSLLQSAAASALDPDVKAQAQRTAKEGISQRWPLVVSPYAAVRSGSEYRSEAQGVTGLPVDATLRFLVPYPGSDLLWMCSGNQAWMISTGRMELVGHVQLPAQANLDDQKGVLLGDRGPDGQTLILYIHLGNDALLDFRYDGQRLRLNYAGKLSTLMPKSKGAYTRWFAPIGAEERFVVCQSGNEAQEPSRLISVPLTPGKPIQDIEASHPLGHLRRLAQTPNLLLVHRQPNAGAMRTPGYFSFAFMDDRLRLTERFHIPPQQLDNVFVEAARWTRLGHDGKRLYFLFSYYEGMTGQLIQRPLAFVAMERSGDLLYAVSDSSTLVQNHGDIEPTAEVVEWNGRDYLACVVRKREVQSLTLVDLATFKLVRRWECPDGERLLSVVRAQEPGSVVCVSMVKSNGALRLRRHSVGEAV